MPARWLLLLPLWLAPRPQAVAWVGQVSGAVDFDPAATMAVLYGLLPERR